MGTPYETIPQSGITVNGGESLAFAVPFFSRGRICIVKCLQYEGVMENFTLELYNRNVILTEHSGSSLSDIDPNAGGVGPIPNEIYHVATLEGVNGVLRYNAEDDGGEGYLYFQQDSNTQGGARFGAFRKPQVYIRLTPSGTGEKKFSLLLGGYQE